MYEGKKIEDFSQDLLNMLSLFFYTKIEKANTLNTVKKSIHTGSLNGMHQNLLLPLSLIKQFKRQNPRMKLGSVTDLVFCCVFLFPSFTLNRDGRTYVIVLLLILMAVFEMICFLVEQSRRTDFWIFPRGECVGNTFVDGELLLLPPLSLLLACNARLVD